jgi:parallel beta-helix repeat protein
MIKSAALPLVTVFLIACILVIPPAKASPRTIVVPDKYATIQSAVGNATDGDKIFVRAGTYYENVVVDKSISLIGEGPEQTVIAGEGLVGVLVRSDGVVLTGFKIVMHSVVRYYYGVHLLSVKDCSVFNNRIENAFYGMWLYDAFYNSVFENVIMGNQNGVKIEASHNNTLAKNTITRNNDWGIFNIGSNNNDIVGNYFSANGDAISLNGYSGTTSEHNVILGNNFKQNTYRGIAVESASYNNIIGNSITETGTEETRGEGILIAAGTQNLIKDNVIAFNEIGIHLEASFNTITQNTVENNHESAITNWYTIPVPTDNKIYGNNFINNYINFSHLASNAWDNGSKGNYWSYYQGIDGNGDGIGDTPYLINSVFIDHYPLMTPINVIITTVDLSSWVTVPAVSSFPGVDKNPPTIVITSPNKETFSTSNLSLTFTVDEQASWMGYSLDGQDNITVTGNITINELTSGLHNITVYAMDEFENTGASATVFFSVELPQPKPFPVAPVAVASITTIAVVGVGLLVYFKKRKR